MKQIEGQTDWIKSFFESAVEWWGESWYEGENLKGRLELVKKYGKGTEVLELAAGTGETAAFLCENSYSVTAVDFCKANIDLLNKLKSRYEKLSVINGNMLDLKLDKKFSTICLFEAFGYGSDKEQRMLLRNISYEWLSDDGCLIMDVFHPYMAIRSDGKKLELGRLENIAGSVDMTNYTYFDQMKCRWVDVWEPKKNKENKRAQSIRCYTPADFELLIENTGLSIDKMEFRGKIIDHKNDEIRIDNIFDNNDRWYSYVVVMRKSES